ncbi:MAG: sensor histidine kinase [Bacteroidetes bacterium]|nr:sensor histidine kinase [Bacteroidota bacterium]
MQIISSLLNLQAEQITDKQMLAIFNDSQSRVRTMALIHEQLYRSFDVGAINLKTYVHYLVQFLERTYHSYNNSVEFCIEVEEFDLSVDLAVPCGLIINELVSNALKYSQGNENICKIALTIFRTFSDKSQIHLVVSDNGLGISDVKIIDNPATLGLQLVQMLTVQLGGNIRIHCGKETKYGGTEISIDFVGN